MTFEVKKMSLDDEKDLFTPANAKVIVGFGQAHVSQTDAERKSWVVDRDRNAQVVPLSNHEVAEQKHRYLLRLDGGIVIFHMPYHFEPEIALLYVDHSLRNRVSEVKELIREAIQVGGRWCVGADAGQPMNVKFGEWGGN